ncbi:MAG: DUF5686 family protein [Bacteroidales bacterium]
MKSQLKEYSLLLLISLLFVTGTDLLSQVSQKTVIQGKVTDAGTGEAIPWVSVLLKATTTGTNTDNEGNYRIETTVSAGEIQYTFLGYETETRRIKTGTDQTINISLKLSSITLSEVTIKPARKNYKNKGNPAVELIENVIKNKELNRRESYSFLEYNKYEKIQFALSNITENFKQSKLFRDFRFIFENMDTTKRIGNDVLPVFIREVISDHYYRREPEGTKEIVRAEKTINFSEYLDNKGVSANLNYLYQDINIYDNEILFLTNKFLSPIAGTAPVFYRYYIQDTLTVKNIKCIKLFFEPRNKADFLFHGNLYVTMDSSYAIRKIDMGINKQINIDWIQDITVTQDFEQFGGNQWLLSREEISIDAGVVKSSLGLYGQRTITYNNYKINEPIDDQVFKGPLTIDRIDPATVASGYWEANRPIPLSKTERGLYTTVDSIKKIPSFKRKMNIVMLLTTEFLDLGKVELGPVGNFYSFNTIEGSRFRFGGRTTTGFSKKITFDGYAAYGLTDRLFKYNAGITYSLTPRTIYQFPVKSLRLSFQKDTRIPGQELQFSQGDNFFLSFRRGIDDKILINNTLKFEYLNEYENHFSYLIGYNFTRQKAGGNLHFTRDYLSPEAEVRNIDISEAYLDLRYAPNESFYQGKLYRDHFPNRYPVMQLKAAVGSELIHNDFNYLRLQFNTGRRYYLSILGYTDITFEAGKIFGTVPYPLMFIHRANQTYSYQKNAYNLMNFLEFVSDQYVSINIDHSFNGFILNKIPLIKKLKFREIITFKALYGRLRDANNPDLHEGLFKFPVGDGLVPLTFTFEGKPYIEASLGLSNILRIFRVDLVKRLTYLENPNVSDFGIRIQFRFDI